MGSEMRRRATSSSASAEQAVQADIRNKRHMFKYSEPSAASLVSFNRRLAAKQNSAHANQAARNKYAGRRAPQLGEKSPRPMVHRPKIVSPDSTRVTANNSCSSRKA